MAAGTYLPDSNIHYTANDGSMLAGGTLTFYEAGTSTLLDTYNDPDLNPLNANPNPYTLNASGWCDDPIFLAVAAYKLVVKNSAGVTLWTRDDISAVSLTNYPIGQTAYPFGGAWDSPFSNTTYPAGTAYADQLVGTTSYSVNSSLLVGVFELQAMLKAVGGGTVSLALVNLTDGSPSTPLVELQSSSAAGQRQQSGPITFAAPGAAKDYAIKVKVSSGTGFAWGVQLLRTA